MRKSRKLKIAGFSFLSKTNLKTCVVRWFEKGEFSIFKKAHADYFAQWCQSTGFIHLSQKKLSHLSTLSGNRGQPTCKKSIFESLTYQVV